MGELIKFEHPQQARERESKVFTEQVKVSLALANVVTRELRKFGCKVVMTGVSGVRPFLVVETDTPIHTVQTGRFGLALQRTPGRFRSCHTQLLGCEVYWRIRDDEDDRRLH